MPSITWYQSSQRLVVLVPVPVGLPPVGIGLADDVKDVSLLEGQAQLPARHVGVVGRVVVKMGLDVHLEQKQVSDNSTGTLSDARGRFFFFFLVRFGLKNGNLAAIPYSPRSL